MRNDVSKRAAHRSQHFWLKGGIDCRGTLNQNARVLPDKHRRNFQPRIKNQVHDRSFFIEQYCQHYTRPKLGWFAAEHKFALGQSSEKTDTGLECQQPLLVRKRTKIGLHPLVNILYKQQTDCIFSCKTSNSQR